VKPIGQLHHDHPNVLGHCQKHLAEVFRLRFDLGAEHDLGQLADPIDEFRHLTPETLAKLLFAYGRIF
jgi:hypothetical protein